MPPRRNLCILSSPEQSDSDDVVSLLPPQSTTTSNNNSNELHLQNMTLNSSTTPTSIPHHQIPSISPLPLNISSSSEDERDSPLVNGNGGVYGEVELILRSFGLCLRREWVESCMRGLERCVDGFLGLDGLGKAKMCLEQFMKADMNYCGVGVLPENVHCLHMVELKGPFVLQVDEIVNISCPLRSRYQKSAPGIKRCLKLSMTDGVQRVFGMEYRPIGALDVFAPAGMKVAISNVCVRHGLLMLVPEVFAVLGGVVEELEAARERLVQELNKPPRGKRTRMVAVPPLANRATTAAWPQGNVNGAVQTNSRVDSSSHLRTAEQGTAFNTPAHDRAREHTVLPNHQEARTTSFSASALNGAALHTPAFRAPSSDREREQHSTIQSHQEARTTSCSASALNGAPLHTPAFRAPSSDGARKHSTFQSHQEAGTTSFCASALDGAALHTPAIRPPSSDMAREHSTIRSHQEAGTTSFSASTFNEAVLHTPASFSPASDRAREHTPLQSHEETGTTSFSASASNGAVLHTPAHRITEDITPSSHRHSMETNYSAVAMDVEEINMADGLELPYILSGEKEMPFTYLASLSAKWAAIKGKVRHVQGMIKCVLTGVKRFQYRGTDKYELQLHIDDGSLISEILIDHNLVERLIGHPPQVVAAGITSKDENLVINMKRKLTQFQKFLANFEGMMFIQFNDSCPLPLVLEMNEGCTVSDAWKLLRRLKPSTSTRQPQHGQLNPIELSP